MFVHDACSRAAEGRTGSHSDATSIRRAVADTDGTPVCRLWWTGAYALAAGGADKFEDACRLGPERLSG
jgi:hypothetical protein